MTDNQLENALRSRAAQVPDADDAVTRAMAGLGLGETVADKPNPWTIPALATPPLLSALALVAIKKESVALALNKVVSTIPNLQDITAAFCQQTFTTMEPGLLVSFGTVAVVGCILATWHPGGGATPSAAQG